MSKGLEELNKLVSHIETEYHSDDYYECINAKSTIETELKALEIIKEWFEVFEDENGYHIRTLYNIGRITKEEYDLLKEVLCE